MTRLDVACINVPRKVGPRSWRRCFALTANRSDIFGLNESLTTAQRNLYIREAKKRDLSQYGTHSGPNPIYYDRDIYRLISGRQIRFHGAGKGWLARRYPGYNSARSATEVVLERRDGVGPQIAVINAHLVPNGRKVNPLWRRQMRAQSLAILRREIADHVAAGRIVVVMGDTNIHGRIKLPGVQWLKGRGIDKVGVAVPAGVRITSKHASTFTAPTDHKRGVMAGITYKEAVR